MARYTDEFANKEVRITRMEYAEITANLINDIIAKYGKGDNADDIRALLMTFTALVMQDMFEELEIEGENNIGQ